MTRPVSIDAARRHPDRDLAEARRIVTEARCADIPSRYTSLAPARAEHLAGDRISTLPSCPKVPCRPDCSQKSERLEDSNILYTVDLVNLDEADQSFRERVLQGVSCGAPEGEDSHSTARVRNVGRTGEFAAKSSATPLSSVRNLTSHTYNESSPRPLLHVSHSTPQ